MSAYEPHDTMVEALRRANPVPAEQVAGRRSQPSAQALFADIIAQPPSRRRSRTRKRALVIAIAIILIAMLAAAFVFVRRDKSDLTLSVACFAAADLDARRVVTADVRDPARACAAIWSGERQVSSKGVRPAAGSNFDVCVLPSRVTAVFPGESGSVCKGLGLTQYKSSGNDVATFTVEVGRRVDEKCIGYAETVRIVKEELAKFELTGWTIKRAPRRFDAAHPCASLDVQAGPRRVTVVPWPGAFPPDPANTG